MLPTEFIDEDMDARFVSNTTSHQISQNKKTANNELNQNEVQTQHIPKSKRLYLLLGFAAIVVGVAVVLAVVLTSTWVPPNQTSTVIESPTQPPSVNASDTT